MSAMTRPRRQHLFALLLLCTAAPSGGLAREAGDPLPDKIQRISTEDAMRSTRLAALIGAEGLANWRLADLVDEGSIVSIHAPAFGSVLSNDQILYLWRHAVFRNQQEAPRLHLAPAAGFTVTLRSGLQIGVTSFRGGPVLQAKIEEHRYWLEFPDNEHFRALGRAPVDSGAASKRDSTLSAGSGDRMVEAYGTLKLVHPGILLSDIAALRRWASFPLQVGGNVELIHAEGKEVAIVRRSLGSGTMVCALSVFIKTSDGWLERLSLAPYRGRWLDFARGDDNVVIRDHESGAEYLRFSLRRLFTGV